MKEQVLKLRGKNSIKYIEGYPLIREKDLEGVGKSLKEGSVVRLEDGSGNFIARGYIGSQNKGAGWVLSRKENEAIDEAFFYNRIAAALGKRSRYFADHETTAFRIFNGEGDGIGGLTIDFFDGYCLINWYSLGIYRFKETIVEALSAMTAAKGIYEKKRFDTGGKYLTDDDFVKGLQPEFPLIVREKGVKYAVYLNEGAMTGIFLDQREVRGRLKEVYSKGKTVLNTFSYTGAFSVAAALGGAKKTVSIDLANRSLERTMEQFEINGLGKEGREIVVEDVFKYFKRAVKQGLLFDIVVLDPPSFARSKENIFSAPKDYGNLVSESAKLLKDGGLLIASTNCAAFDMTRFKEMVKDGFKQSDATFNILEEYRLPEDFRICESYSESDYLKVLFLRVGKRA
ncbi:MAG: class I SAM-dependent rRNA methyltransferase [Peptostreptococcaceae bacterium]|nr:class I SAM-dependent rRNA methyltransferase [Peptostreptococcaceae bacterium]